MFFMFKQVLFFAGLVCLFCLPSLVFAADNAAASQNDQCANPLSDDEVKAVFKKNALNQLALEFGEAGAFVYEIELFAIDSVMVNLESYARYQKPGQKDLARMRLKGWVSRCGGTTIIRGNNWLADGTLKVQRYAAKDLKGQGLIWGKRDAPMQFIVYVDSRCPHCHRLIDYARKLVEEGKVMLDIRQVAYLEEKQDAILDTKLSESSLVIKNNPGVSDKNYLEMLEGNANVEDIETSSMAYKKALKLIRQNTETAEKILHIITVPGVLVREKEHNNLYRKMGYWEINRIFQ